LIVTFAPVPFLCEISSDGSHGEAEHQGEAAGDLGPELHVGENAQAATFGRDGEVVSGRGTRESLSRSEFWQLRLLPL
jgi:hypothetical protein